MPPSRRTLSGLITFAGVLAGACALWMFHADAWSLGRRSPVLDQDTAAEAVAARDLARSGRFETPFAMPLMLVRHPRPPWPTTAVEPGMVGLEALAFRLAPVTLRLGSFAVGDWNRPDQLEWLIVPIPFTCFILLGAVAAIAALKLLRGHAPSSAAWHASLAAAVIGLGLVLDPESQHLAVGSHPALPFALGLLGASSSVALGLAPLRPLAFGLTVGAALLFRTGAAWMVPVMVVAAAATVAPGARARVAVLALLGSLAPLVPWWIHEHAFFDSRSLAGLSMWDGVGSRSLFAMLHVPEPPDLPRGLAAAGLLTSKTLHRLPAVLLRLATGPGALWLGATLVAAWDGALHRNLRVAARMVLALVAGFAVSTALTGDAPGALHGARMLLGIAGPLATLALCGRAAALAGAGGTTGLRALALALVLGWGGWQAARAAREASAVAATRTTPSTLTLLQVSVLLSREVPNTEAVVSNLGPLLAWHARRPVVHLPLAPEDLERCRERLDFQHVLLVFRGTADAWPAWQELVARPLEARNRADLNVRRVRVYRSADGYQIAWLELGTPPARYAQR